jgi:hypothetical protein
MAETLCPACDFSPIEDGAEACPRCGERFDFVPAWKRAQAQLIDRRFDSESMEQTAIGGAVAGALSFHPGPAAAGLYALAAAWFARAAVQSADSGEAAWGFLLALVGVAGGTGLLVGGGWARRAAQGASAVGVLAALGLGGGGPATLLYALLGALCLSSVLGEPSQVRRSVTLGCVLSVAGLCVLSLFVRRPVSEAPADPAADALRAMGVILRTPKGLSPATALGSPLALPPATLTSGSAAFVGEAGRAVVLTVLRAEQEGLPDACQAHARQLGAQGPGVRLQRPAPASLGPGALVLELGFRTGEVALLACGRRPDGRTVAVAALGAGGLPEDAAAVLDAVGAGLSLR